ncbi:helix-turn-helix transcriptional regulator [Lujinxingia vulgaris]|uniref:Helix-turn-helix transcriptional regulator n=1 Tax=Lujinxingia vulgaris TaxID=2600176 RepID=A0A5C6X911_9DELT|nr:AraC family transcriptional regulator [Lujinxingia vulgaris]TXD35661.1 helix-turn-helix transcriptional regulator [Lujinxingia vulgaris]
MTAPLVAERWSGLQGLDPSPVLPDGCRDLILRVPPDAAPILHLSPLDTTAREVQTAPGTHWLGLRLYAGTTARDGRAIDAAQLLECPDSRALINKIHQHPDEAEALLRELISTHLASPPPVFLDYLAALSSTENAATFPRQLGVSDRTLRRHITRATGASPSFWRQLSRIRRCARQIARTELPLADIALNCAFSDQAHMQREVRRWFGTTPAQIRAQAPTYALRLREPERGL